MSGLFRPLLAEFLGTFTLVFIGAFAVAVTATPQTGVLVPALAHGIVLVGIIYAYGHISGAHFNPAVTLALLVGRHIAPVKAALYMVAQFAGGIVAGVTLLFILGNGTNYGVTTGMLTRSNIGQAMLLEGILTFFLVTTIYQAAVYGKAGNLAPVAIGFTLVGCILAGGVYSGASLNPARTLGPALVSGDLSYVAPYLVAIFAGGGIAGVVHTFLLKSK